MSNPNYSTGNVIAAICSLICPGLGQLVQGRFLASVFYFFSVILLCATGIGILVMWIPWLVSIISAAKYNPYK